MAIDSQPGTALDLSDDPLTRTRLTPSWPLVALFGLIPLWWALGWIDLIWMPMALVMSAYLINSRNVRAPRGFGIWLLFLVWMACSLIEVNSANHAIAFLYRAAIYLSCTVFFLYVYNSREKLTGRRVCGALTLYWLWTVGGGFLGIVLPSTAVKTPTFFVLRYFSKTLPVNDFVNHMVVRRFAQYNPDSYLGVSARPSAPFLYANNWGNAYSLLLPFVVAYLIYVRRTRRFWPLVVVVALSPVPAFLTLNRGMLIGLSLAAVYIGLRLAFRGNLKSAAFLAVCAIIAGLVFQHLAASRLETRLQGSGTSTRASLYQQSIELVPSSPVFGFGVPPTSTDSNAPPVGTQGQFWLVLVSNGPVATAAFVFWFLYAWFRSRRRRDVLGMAASTVLLISVVELVFYGVVPYGLPIMMVAAGLALRGRDLEPSALDDPRQRLALTSPALGARGMV